MAYLDRALVYSQTWEEGGVIPVVYDKREELLYKIVGSYGNIEELRKSRLTGASTKVFGSTLL